MTAKQRTYRNSLLRSIHTAPVYRQQFADDREAWEELLLTHYRVRSSAKLSIDDLRSLSDFLHGRSSAPQPASISDNQLSFLLALWEERSTHKDIFSLLRFVRRITGREIEDLRHLTRVEATKLIAAVRNFRKREPVNNIGFRKSEE